MEKEMNAGEREEAMKYFRMNWKEEYGESVPCTAMTLFERYRMKGKILPPHINKLLVMSCCLKKAWEITNVGRLKEFPEKLTLEFNSIDEMLTKQSIEKSMEEELLVPSELYSTYILTLPPDSVARYTSLLRKSSDVLAFAEFMPAVKAISASLAIYLKEFPEEVGNLRSKIMEVDTFVQLGQEISKCETMFISLYDTLYNHASGVEDGCCPFHSAGGAYLAENVCSCCSIQ